MSLSDFEIQKITEIVAGKVGAKLDAKQLRSVIDSVVDKLEESPVNPDIKGVTCEVPAQKPDEGQTGTPDSPEPGNITDDEDMITTEGGLYQQIEHTDKSRIIIAAFGRNRPGVVASITNVLAELNCSIEDISQTLMQEFFSMIMVVDIKDCPIDFAALRDKIKGTENLLGMKVYVMHEDIFRYMHRI